MVDASWKPIALHTISNISTAEEIVSALSTMKTSATYKEIAVWKSVAVIHFSRSVARGQFVGALRDPKRRVLSVATCRGPAGGVAARWQILLGHLVLVRVCMRVQCVVTAGFSGKMN